MELPPVADDGDNGSLGRNQKRDLRVVPRFGICPAGASECADFCLIPLTLLRRFKERDGLGGGSRPSCFNVVNPERVELFCDPNLVVDTEGNAFSLRAISQSRI